MDLGIDQFYVGLLSNESMPDYPENSLSAFTNKLARGIQIDENWVVGLTSISFPPYLNHQRMQMATPEMQEEERKKRLRRETEIDDTVETFNPITVNEPPPKKKRPQREYRKLKQKEEKKIVIKVSDTENIVLTQSDIKKLTYQNSSNLNCGILLQVLDQKIEPKIDVSNAEQALKREILKGILKNELFTAIIMNKWNLVDDPVKLRRQNDEYVVHVYQNSKKSNNIILKYRNYESLNEFIAFILSQLPVECRTPAKLSPLLNLFHESYSLLENKVEIVRPKKTVNLLIPFQEYGASTGLNTQDLVQGTSNLNDDSVSLDKILEMLRENLIYKDDRALTSAEKVALRTMIKEKIIDALRLDNAMDTPYTIQTPDKDDIILNMPIEKIGDNKYNTYKIVLKAREWDDAKALLNSVIAQIPLEKRNRDVFIDALEENFTRAIKGKKSTEVLDLTTQNVTSMQQQATGQNVWPASWPAPLPPSPPLNSSPDQQKNTPDEQIETDDSQSKAADPVLDTNDSQTKKPDTPLNTPDTQPDTNESQTKTPDTQTDTNESRTKTPDPPQNKPAPDTSRKNTDTTDLIVGSRRDVHKNRLLFVYSDIIQSRIFGEQQIRCLKVLPLTDANTRDMQSRFVEYIPVQKTYIDSISIMLCNSFGEQIEFNKSDIPTFCMLHFKRK